MSVNLHFSVKSTFEGETCWIGLGPDGYKFEPAKSLEFMRTAAHEYFTEQDMVVYKALWAHVDAHDSLGNRDMAQAWHTAWRNHPLHKFEYPSAHVFVDWLQSQGYATHDQIKALLEAEGTTDVRFIRLACAWLGFDMGAATLVEALHFV